MAIDNEAIPNLVCPNKKDWRHSSIVAGALMKTPADLSVGWGM